MILSFGLVSAHGHEIQFGVDFAITIHLAIGKELQREFSRLIKYITYRHDSNFLCNNLTIDNGEVNWHNKNRCNNDGTIRIYTMPMALHIFLFVLLHLKLVSGLGFYCSMMVYYIK